MSLLELRSVRAGYGIGPDILTDVTIDVEEYFHIEAAYGTVKRDEWNDWPSRVEQNMDLLLDLLDQHGHKATFFILGDVAKRQPLVLDTQQMKDRRVDIVDLSRVVSIQRLVAPLVARPISDAALNPPTGEPIREDVGIMIATTRALS